MNEKRVGPRQRVLKGGKIVYGDGAFTVECTIRDLSSTGARLRVPASITIPDRFVLVETQSGVRRATKVTWRRGDLVGVQFE